MTKNARNDRQVKHEQLLLVAHLAHTEIHICELIERTSDKKTLADLQLLLHNTKELRIKTMKSLSDNVEIIWCTLKHLLLAYIHALEVAEKQGLEYLELSKNIMLQIDTLISSKTITSKNVLECPRCTNDINNIKEKNND